MGVSFTQHLLRNCAQGLRLPVPQAAALGLGSLCCVPPPGFEEVSFKFKWDRQTSVQVTSLSRVAALLWPRCSTSLSSVGAITLWMPYGPCGD